ncbi:MAG: hypothetical protein ACRDU9_11145, partial [Acidimicrobiia bacterium]
MTVPFVLPALLAEPKPPDAPIVLLNARVFDGTGAGVTEVEYVVVEHGRLSDRVPDEEGVALDLEGRFLMPGLIDAHTH